VQTGGLTFLEQLIKCNRPRLQCCMLLWHVG